MRELISIVVPMYFEEEVAGECYQRISNVAKSNHLNYEIIFVNDGSKDKTFEILKSIAKKDTNVRVINFSRNFGHQIAITAGIEKAGGDAVVVIDADLQDPPELIPQMISLWKEGYDVVYAKRKSREGERWFKLFTAKVFYRFLNKMTNVAIPVDTGDYRLMDRKVVEVFKRMPEKNRFVRGMVSWLGFRQIPLEYERKERFAGETKYPLKKMLKFAADGIMSFSSKPIKYIQYSGILTVLISLAIFITGIISRLLGSKDIMNGLWTIMTAGAFIGGIQLVSIGILGEYVTRIYDESKRRPLYITDSELNFNVEFKNSDNNENGDNIRRIV